MEIPYTTELRPDTGVTNPTLGMWLFLASEVMLFGSLFSSYALLRAGAPSWPDQSAVLSVPMAAANTIILVASSITIRRSWTALQTGKLSRYRLLMGLTLLLGTVFLTVKGVEYADKIALGLLPSSNNFLGLYYTMTGVHALHVLAGLVVNAYLLGPGARMWTSAPQRFTNRVELAGLYWHFVDLIWLILFPVLYLI
jgi:heme/copper-type cytochrome/quinol oxidase subunit 3